MVNLSFSSFLTEQILLEQIGNDSRGKLHEILFAKHLHPDKKMPTHFRNKHGSTPQEVHDFIKKQHPEHYSKIEMHSKSAAEHVLRHLHDHKLIPKGHVIHSVSWTSNRDMPNSPGDHEKLTGTKDVHSNADVIVTHHHPKTGKKGHVGVSLKYGSASSPTLRGPGLKDMEHFSGADVKHHQQRANEELHKHTGIADRKVAKARFKKLKASKKPADQKQAAHLSAIAQKHNINVAKDVHKALSSKPHHELVKVIKHLTASHDNHIPHIRSSTHPDTGHTKISSPSADFDKLKTKYHKFRVRPHNGTAGVHIDGVKRDGKADPVVKLSVKNNSSPHSNIVGIVKAPGLSKVHDDDK